MKRAAEESRRAKRDVIFIDDADEPPVKKEAEEPAPSAKVVELLQQLKQSDEKFRKLCDVARRDKEALKARVDYLETLVDSKDGILNKPDNASVDNELKKKVVELEKQLNEERQISAEMKKKLEQVEAQLQQQPVSGPNLDAATGSLGSQPSDAAVASRANQARKQQSSVSSFREIQENEYSNYAKRSLSPGVSRNRVVDDGRFLTILRSLRFSPRLSSIRLRRGTYALYTNQNIPQGTYIAELCGYVSLQSECSNRDLPPGQWVNDRTFLIEEDGEKLLLDARRMGNVARFVRRSCKPNAELKVLIYDSNLHVLIKAKDGVEIKVMQEVTIKFDDGWKQLARSRCTCKGDELETCEIELFFNKQRSKDDSKVGATAENLPSTSKD